MLADDHDAEDATQAVFLALSQHARSIRRQESVAGWLHGVALHTARSYRRKLGRSRARDAAHAVPEVVATPDAFDELSVREAREVLHAELDRLPERYKSPLVLIYLEELSHAEAARALGWSPGRFRGRLERARAMLGQRLVAHKLTFGGALALAGLAIAVPKTLAAEVATTTLAIGVTGSAVGAMPTVAIEVAAEVGRTVALAKAPSIAAGLVAAAVVGGVGAVALTVPNGGRVPEPGPPPGFVTSQPRGWGYHVGHVVMTTGEGFYVLNPDGGSPAGISAPLTSGAVTRFRCCPTALAYEKAGPAGRTLHLWRYADPFSEVPLAADIVDFFWCQETRRLVVTTPSGDAFLLDELTLARKPLKLPAGLRAIDASPTGDTLLCVRPGEGGRAGLCLHNVGTGQSAAVADDLPADLAPRWRLAPDLSRAAGMTRNAAGQLLPALAEVATRRMILLPPGDVNDFLAWSPDSRAVLLARRGPGGELDAIAARRLDLPWETVTLDNLVVTRFRPEGDLVQFRPRAADWQR